MINPTPKFRSTEFKEILGELKAIFDAHSLGVTILDALERPVAEQVYSRFARQEHGTRMANIKKAELVGQLTSGFFSSEDVAYQLIKELDRACQKERHIVDSIPEEQAPERIGSYRAIALKRERAKFVWALARDQRASVRNLANRVIKEFFAEAADIETTRAVLEGTEDQSALKDMELAKRLHEQAGRLSEAAKKVTDLESQVSRYEDERARLLAQIGAKERSLKQESEAREEREAQLLVLRRALEEVESGQRAAQAAVQNEVVARATAEELAQKVRRLEKLAAASKALTVKEDELERTLLKSGELERELERQRGLAGAAEAELEQERARHKSESEAARDELHQLRKRLTELEKLVPDGAGRAPAKEGSLLLLLDQANLAAAAHVAFGRKVNFAALYDRLRAGRPVARAVAFVVDNGGAGFEPFCDTLRRAGWDLRIKKPRTFQNGQVKADWDMGIAMEAIERADQATTIVLVSGDGDFVPLVKHLKRSGKRVEVASFNEGLAVDLANAADAVSRLDAGTLE